MDKVMRARSISLYDETFDKLVKLKNKKGMTHDELLNCLIEKEKNRRGMVSRDKKRNLEKD